MTAELLRRAAKEMRERAEAATAGPYELYDFKDPRPMMEIGFGVRGDEMGHLAEFVSWDSDTPAHLASWHPAVALAVADWLDNEAGHYDATIKGLGVHPAQAESAYTFPLAVARAYLGETS